MTQKKLAFIRKLFKRHRREHVDLNQGNNNSSSTSSTDAGGDTDEESDAEAGANLPVKQEPTSLIPLKAAFANRNTGCRLYLQQCHAYLDKRRHCVLRSKRGWFLEVAIPALTVIIMMLIVATYPIDSTQRSMPLHPWLMSNKMNVPHLDTFFSNTPTNNSKIKATSYAYSQAIASPQGWSGTRCLPHFEYVLIPKKYAYCNLQDYTVPNPLPALTPEGIQQVIASENISCSCKHGDFICPSQATVHPPNHLLPTTDFLMNLTHYNVSNYLLKSRNEAILKRYGGLTFMVTKGHTAVVATQQILSNTTLIEFLLNNIFESKEVTNLGLNISNFLLAGLPPTQYTRVWYHNKGFASSTAYLNVLHNLQLRMLLAKIKVPGKASVILFFFKKLFLI